MTTTTVRLRLRSETRALHDATDAALSDLHDPADAEAYAAALRSLRRAWAALEAATDAWHQAHGIIDWPTRRRLADLDADLAELGSGSLPDAVVVDGAIDTDLARGLGRLYVLEGSSLGAAAIVRRLGQRRATAGLPKRFFERAARPAGRWPSFLAVLDQHVRTPADADAAVAGAADAFALVLGAVTVPAGTRP